MRSQMNYALVLFATGKILGKLQLKEAYLNIVESLFSEKVVPRHMQLLDQDEGRADSAVDYNEEEVAEMTAVVNRIVQSCSVVPEKTKHFFIPKTSLIKCKCGDVLGFKVLVDEVLVFTGKRMCGTTDFARKRTVVRMLAHSKAPFFNRDTNQQ